MFSFSGKEDLNLIHSFQRYKNEELKITGSAMICIYLLVKRLPLTDEGTPLNYPSRKGIFNELPCN